MNITVVGMGYVGCVTASCLARDGNRVVGVDIDRAKVDSINAGVPPLFEPGLESLLKTQIENGRLSATTDLAAAVADSETALIAVGTPSGEDGSVDYTVVTRVVGQVGRCLEHIGNERPFTVIVRSTLLPGILEEVLGPVLAQESGEPIGDRIQLCNNPEFLRETTAINDYDKPPFVLVGANNEIAASNALKLYSDIDCEKIVTTTREAAMVKYASNAYHALKIAYANEIGTLAKSLGADGQRVMDVACRDNQLNISKAYLRPGFAFGGSCLPKDVRALARHAEQNGLPCEVIQSILPSNLSHLQRAMTIIRQTGKRRIGLIGLSFKAGTDDLRESPQVLLAELLLGQGYELDIFDPDVRVTSLIGSNRHYIDDRLPHLARLLCHDPNSMLRRCDLLVVATAAVEKIDLGQYCGEIVDLRTDLVIPRQEKLEMASSDKS